MIDVSSVRKFINTELLYREDQRIVATENLIEKGVIDSMSLLRLISYLEDCYGIEIPDEEILPDNFRSLSSIETLVANHLGGTHLPEGNSK